MSADAFPLVEWAIVLVSFAVFATVRSQVPGVNEPHYLTKAKHFWDPAWCSRDPFLNSSNAHYVFYATVGILTQFCSLEMAAWLGRIIGWVVLSSGWTALARRLLPFRWGAVWSAWVFLCLASIGNWSGEWVVGGIEAKVLSYGCGWWSLASALSGRSIQAAAWSGAAVSFHPVVGIWNTAAVLCALFMKDWRIWRVIRHLPWKELAWCAGAWLALSAPGLIPAISMLRGADQQQTYQADYIQVFHRLSHHLDPWKFSAQGYWEYVTLILMSCVLFQLTGRAPRWTMTARYVVAAVGIAVAGVVVRAIPDVARFLLQANIWPAGRIRLQAWIDYQPHLAGLLKFYPFRLADVAVPWVSALLIVLFVQRRRPQREGATATSANSGWLQSGMKWLAFGGCLIFAVIRPAVDRNPSRLPPALYADWIDACYWLKRESPPDALCFAANDGWSLRWFAERADYLSHKDCPQDAAGIIAWNERFKLIARWSSRSVADGFTASELRELRRQTGIDYLVSYRFGPVLLTPVYQNQHYRVYRLPE